MASTRKIDWTAAMRDLRADRAKPVPGFLSSRSLELARLDRLAKEAGYVPFVSGASFNRSAIMTAAVARARLMRAKGSKAPWEHTDGLCSPVRLDLRQAAARHGSTLMALGSNTMALEPRPLAAVLEEPAPEFITFLFCARQSRLLARACPTEAQHYKSCCRYWLAMAHKAQGPPLP